MASMSTVDYSHDINRDLHTVRGASKALGILFPNHFPASVLDIGCGTGTWLRAALDRGARDVLGLDGLDVRPELLFVSKELTRQADLNRPIHLGRKFELVICFETAEHLEPENAQILVDTLTEHGERILFSAAAPGQGGTHHVNCRWPDYWQELFNARGYVCSDEPRWKIWQNPQIEPWYRQNIMIVTRDPDVAGKEPRIKPVIHPELLPSYSGGFFTANREIVEQGGLPFSWYISMPLKALATKLARRILK